MTNLIFDLSNIFYRSMWNVAGYGEKKYTFDSQHENDQLCRKVSMDITYIIRLANPSRVIFALDSKSWRKEISIDENDGYKANREKSGAINWDNVFKIMKEFGEILDSNGFIVSQINRAEADDVMCMWKEELLYNQHQHVILVSSDEDIRQLVQYYPYEPGQMAFSTVLNPFTGKKSAKKLYIPEHFTNWLNTDEAGSIFDRSIDVDKEDFMRLRDKEKITFEQIDGNYIGMKKILCGDDGDNVPSIFSWLNDKNKISRITNSPADKIINEVKAKDYIDLLDNSDKVLKQIIDLTKQTPSFKIDERLKRQVKLVILSKFVFPEDITKEFDSKIKDQLNKPNIQPQNWNMNTILEGTRYVKSKGNESSIFRDMDKITKLF